MRSAGPPVKLRRRPGTTIFPNSSAREFGTPEELTEWLAADLRANGGNYRIRTTTAPDEPNRRPPSTLPAGSVVLFRHRDVFVGEAVVRSYDRTAFTEGGLNYGPRVVFDPDSVRLITPPLHYAELEQVSGATKNVQRANSYTVIEDAGVYDRLREVIGRPDRQLRT